MERENGKKKYAILGILFIAWFIGYADKVAINVAAIPISKEFGLDPTQIGVLIASFSFGMAIMSLLGGWAADKFGSNRVLVASIAIWSLFSGFSALAGSFMALLVLRFLYGGAEGFFPPASSVAIAENFKKEESARAKSFLISAGQLGTAFATILVAYLVVSYSWRAAFYIFAALGLLTALVLAIVNRESGKAGLKQSKPKSRKVPLKEALKNPIIWQAPILQFGAGFLMWGLNSWLPQYWVNVKHLDIKTMAAYTMIPMLGTFVMVNVAGWVIDKYFAGREKILLIASLLVTCLSVFLMYMADSIAFGFAYQTAANLAICFLSPTLYALILKYVRKDLVGTATGFIAFGSSVAGIIAPIAMGFSITLLNGSYSAVFGMIIVILLLCVFVAATINTREQAAVNLAEHSV